MLEDGQPCPTCAQRRHDFKNAQKEGCDPVAHSLSVALLQTNRQINNEARSVLYQQIFKFAYEKDMYFFLATIGHKNRKLLESLKLEGVAYSRGLKGYSHPAFTLLADATSLKSFELATNNPGSAKQLYSAMYFWLRSFGGKRSLWQVLKLHPSINLYGMTRRGYDETDNGTGIVKRQIESLLDTGHAARFDGEEL